MPLINYNMFRILILYFLKHCLSAELKSCQIAPQPYDYLCKVQEDYDKTQVPGKPLSLDLYYDIHEVEKVNEVESTITVSLELFAAWDDQKLSYNPKNM